MKSFFTQLLRLASRAQMFVTNRMDGNVLELLYHSRNYVGGYFVGNALNFIALAIFARILSPEAYGMVNIYLSLLTFFTILLGLNFSASVKVNILKREFDRKEYIGSVLLLSFALHLGMIIALSGGAGLLIRVLNIPYLVYFAVVLSAIFATYYELLGAIWVADKESGRSASLVIYKKALAGLTGLAAVLLLHRYQYDVIVICEAVVSFALFLWSVFKLASYAKRRFRKVMMVDALSFGLMLLPASLSNVGLSYFDRIIINSLKGSVDTGYYSLLYTVGMIMSVIVMGMNKSWQPLYWEMLQRKEYIKINRIAFKYAKYIYLCAFGLILFSGELVKILGGSRYESVTGLVPIVVISFVLVFLYTLYSGVAFYSKRTKLISLNTVMAALVNLGLNLLLIPRYGYQVAAYTTLVSYGLLFVLHYLNSRYVLKFNELTLRVTLPEFVLLCVVSICGWFGLDYLSQLIHISSLDSVPYYVLIFPLKIMAIGAWGYYLFLFKHDWFHVRKTFE